MNRRPAPGDMVRLNDAGMATIGGLHSAEEVRQSQRMTVTEVSENMTDDVPTWLITVDQPLIAGFLLTNHDVDLL